MYIPASFAEVRIDVLQDLIESHPLGALITAAEDGLFATHIPFVIDRTSGAFGTLRGHIARANPHHRLAQQASEGLVIFTGPDAYVSPAFYPSKADHGRVVPTWNYVAVHAYGGVRFVDELDYVLRNVEALTRRHEAGRERPWSVSDAPPEYLEGLARAVVGVEIAIVRLEGKWKMSQNREARDAAGVAAGLATSERENEREVARLVTERQALRKPPGSAEPTPDQP